MTSRRDTSNGTRTAPRFFTVGDIADLLDVSTRSVRRWIKSGDLRVHRFGAAVRISESDLKAFASARRDG